MQVMTRRLSRGARTEGGAVAIMIAISMTLLLVVTAMVLDFGLVRFDRQGNKLAADAAVMSGLRAADGGTGQVYTSRGVCGALQFLIANEPALAGLPLGDCTTPDQNRICKPSDASTWTSYSGTTTSGGRDFTVTIKSPYTLTDGNFPEEATYASLASDTTQMSGCDQLGVVISQSRKPGLGSLATSSNLATRSRSVGRVSVAPGDQAPALLLLDRTHCNVVDIGSAGSGSWIHVLGSSHQPGTIHADSDRSSCSGTDPIFHGKQSGGIVAYASTDLSKPGEISSVAIHNGLAQSAVSDYASSYTYASTVADASTAPTAAKQAVTGRSLVTREFVDKRYLEPVRSAITAANDIFSGTGLTDWKKFSGTDCNPTSATFAGVTTLDRVWMDCGDYKSDVPLIAREVYFSAGTVKTANLPNAQKVYIAGTTSDAISLNGTNDKFTMHTADALTLGGCKDGTVPTGAQLIVRSGALRVNGGELRLCNTAVIFMGGSADGCLPAPLPPVQAPTSTPCSITGTTGNGFLKFGGSVKPDWTAPNQYDVIPDADKLSAWSQLEDLAYWSESYGRYDMAGSSNVHLVGVFMAPNAAPFTVTGSGLLDLNDAQFIANSFEVNGGARLQMKVDPNSVVTLPTLKPFTLIR